MKISEIIYFAKEKLAGAGFSVAEREAVWLLQCVLGKKRLNLDEQILASEKEKFINLLKKRLDNYPLQYLIGSVDFFDVEIYVDENVLIPRHETEEMAEAACEMLGKKSGKIICADLGTGSGCLAVSLAKKLEDTVWHVCDKSEPALRVARKNARRNFVSEKINFYCGDWFSAFPENLKFDFVIANPPYVEAGAKLQAELFYEPPSALFSGADGLDDYRKIFDGLAGKLKKGGVFLGEFGDGQAEDLKNLAEKCGLVNLQILTDCRGKERMIKTDRTDRRRTDDGGRMTEGG